MPIYDATVSLGSGMPLPTWDGEPGPELRPIKQIGVAGEAAQVSILTIGTHCGTHIDAPSHFIPGAGGVESLSLDALVGPCRVVQIAASPLIQPSDLAVAVGASPPDLAGGAQRLLLKTRSGAFWDDPTFRRDFVALSPAAAEWL